MLSIFKPGDRIVVGDNIYGGSYSQLNEFFTRWGIIVEAVDTQDIAALEPPSRATARTASCLPSRPL